VPLCRFHFRRYPVVPEDGSIRLTGQRFVQWSISGLPFVGQVVLSCGRVRS
jgi:hypothetical protein